MLLNSDPKTKDQIQSMVLFYSFFIHRFLTVRPSTTEDVSLLTSVLGFLQTLVTVKISTPHRPAINGYLVVGEGLAWLTENTCDSNAMCLQLLQSSLDSTEQSQHSNPHR